MQRELSADPVDVAVWRYLAHDPRVTDERKRDYARGRLDALDEARSDTATLETRLDQRKDPSMDQFDHAASDAHIAYRRELELAHLPEAERAKRLDAREELDPKKAAIAAVERMEAGR
jgi:hypothetical protein